MATLGKDLKGGGKSKSGGKAKVALAKAKLSTMQDADMIRKLAEQSKRILMVSSLPSSSAVKSSAVVQL